MADDFFCYMKMFILEKQPFFENISYKEKIFLPKPFRRAITFRDSPQLMTEIKNENTFFP